MSNVTIKKWELLHEQSRFRPQYPSELVVQYVFRNFNRDGNTKVLDLGCGAGRHSFFMARENIDVYGTDISSTGVKYTMDLCGKYELKGEFQVAPIDKIPYEDEFFDGVICFGVLYYCDKETIKRACKEIYRVLKIQGKAMITVRNIEDYRMGIGKEIEKNTFIIEEQDDNKCAYNENGMVMHFFEREEIKQYFSEFTSISIDEITETHEDGCYKDSNYIIQLVK